jgi:hypothetical protein
LATEQQPNPKVHIGESPRPKYETPQDELEPVTPTDPDASHLDPEAIADSRFS